MVSCQSTGEFDENEGWWMMMGALDASWVRERGEGWPMSSRHRQDRLYVLFQCRNSGNFSFFSANTERTARGLWRVAYHERESCGRPWWKPGVQDSKPRTALPSGSSLLWVKDDKDSTAKQVMFGKKKKIGWLDVWLCNIAYGKTMDCSSQNMIW